MAALKDCTGFHSGSYITSKPVRWIPAAEYLLLMMI